MKKVLAFTLALIMIICMVPNFACAAAQKDIAVTIDGKPLALTVKPATVDGRTLVPLRAIFEALGANVQWDAYTRTITGTKGTRKVVLVLDQKTATVNNIPVQLQVAPMIIGESTMVPVRFISEALGAQVVWDGPARTVRITTKISLLSTGEAFACDISLSTDYGIRDRWNYSTGANRPKIRHISKLYPGQVGLISLYFTGYAKDTGYNAEIYYDISVTGPNGTLAVADYGVRGLAKNVGSDNIARGDIDYQFRLDNAVPGDVYKITVAARDIKGGNIIQASQSFTITEYRGADFSDGSEKIRQAIAQYYDTDYAADRLNAMFVQFCNEPEDDYIVMTFFAEAYSKNRFLLKYLPQKLGLQKENVQSRAAQVLEYINMYINKIDVAGNVCVAPDLGEIDSVDMIEMYWGQYFASSSIRSFERLMESLQYEKYVNTTKGTENLIWNSLTAEQKKGWIYKNGKTVLESTLASNVIVRDYARYYLKKPGIREDVKKELKLIMSKY